jgi:FSR family fosmidomycin resistance protein-like MFS transporter
MRRFLPKTIPHLSAQLGLAHGFNDFAAGFLLGSLSKQLPLAEAGILILVYNLVAFGGQPLAGLIIDRIGRPRFGVLSGLLLSGSALLVADWEPRLAVLLAGLGSAAFHAGGGALALYETPGKASGPGLFVAPGVFGLAAGGTLALMGYVAAWPWALALLASTLLVARLHSPDLPYSNPTQTTGQSHPASVDKTQPFQPHDAVLLILLVAIALRSTTWTTVELLLKGHTAALLALAAVAAVGKACGGFLADRIGWKRWGIGVLSAAAFSLILGHNSLGLLLFGISLLQSTTPLTLAAMGLTVPRFPATAAGLALGLGILLGALPYVFGIASQFSTSWILGLSVVISALALLWALQLLDRYRNNR